MAEARRHARHIVAELCDTSRRALICSSIAAERVGAPAPERAVRFDGARVHGSSGDVRDGGAKRRYLNWSPAVQTRTIAELTMRVLAPAPESASVGDRASVQGPYGHVDHAGAKANHLHGQCPLADLRPVAKATAAVPSPAPQRARGRNRTRVPTARRDTRHVRAERSDLNRQEAIGRGAVAELTRLVISPAPQRAVRLDSASMVFAPGDVRHIRAERLHQNR
jgi:hypothetical protein